MSQFLKRLFESRGLSQTTKRLAVLNASVNSSSAHPPRATAGHLLTLSVPGVGHSQFYRGPGAGHLRTPGWPPSI